jgi:hypothetical protein
MHKKCGGLFTFGKKKPRWIEIKYYVEETITIQKNKNIYLLEYLIND